MDRQWRRFRRAGHPRPSAHRWPQYYVQFAGWKAEQGKWVDEAKLQSPQIVAAYNERRRRLPERERKAPEWLTATAEGSDDSDKLLSTIPIRGPRVGGAGGGAGPVAIDDGPHLDGSIRVQMPWLIELITGRLSQALKSF